MRFAPWFVAALASNVFALAACGDDGGSSSLTGLTVADVTVSTAEDTPISIAIPVKAGTSSTIMVTIATQPQHGTVAAIEGDNTTYSYTPAANYDGSDSFTATVTDGTNTATGTVNITVTPVDDAPVAGSASFTTPLNTALTIQTSALLADVTDIDSTTLSIVSVQDAINGDAALNGDSITFTPSTEFFGVATFSYTASDGQLTANGIVSVNVGGNNHPPVAMADSATTPENTALVVPAATLLGNDTDADGNTLTITSVSNGQHGAAAFDSGTNTVTFTPDTNFHGDASFDYAISDGNGGTASSTVTVTVTHVNQNPVANPDSVTVAQGTIATINVLANDTDPDGDGLTLTSVTQGANGSVTFTGGVASYTPNANFVGTDSFTYTISDGNGGTATGTVTVVVQGVNHSPVAVADSMTVSENTAGTDNVLANDSDPDGDALVITGTTSPQHGVVSFAGGVATYTPNANFVGSDAFTYTISDGRGGTASATVSVNVVAVNSPPIATNDLFSTPENVAGTVNVTANDHDPDGDPISVSNFTQPAHGAVNFTNNVATYTPTHDFFGNDSFTYTISDGRGGSATGIVSVQVAHVNQQPIAQNDTLATTENNQGSVDVAGNDSDADGDTLIISAFTQPAHGTVAFSNTVALYTPVSNFSGTDSFTYTISDGHGGTATAQVSVTVIPGTPTSSEPAANNDSFTVAEDTALTGNVLTNDTGTGLSALTITPPAHGEFGLNENGTFTYFPFHNFNGTDTFTYEANDGHVDTFPATVTITVTPVNDAPIATSSTTPENRNAHGPFILQLNAFDPDNGDSPPAGDTLTFQIVSQGENGTSVITDGAGNPSPSGDHIKYTPSNEGGFIGPDSVTFTATDNHGAVSNQATVTLSLPSCGDGIVNNSVGANHTAEQCDDGNSTGGDGCEPDCTFTCGVLGPTGIVPDRVTVDPDNGSCFAYYSTQQNDYAAAQAQCVAHGGHLATIADDDENQAVRNAAGGDSPWIGANDIALNGEHWVTGEPFVANFFDDLNNEGGGCGTLDGDSTGWSPENCTTQTQSLLCEFDLFPIQDAFATSGTASSVVTGDFNDDGFSDVAYLNVDTQSIGVMLGDGLGGFRAQTVVTLQTTPTAVATGDFDGDGFSDLVVSNKSQNTVTVFLNNEDGTFAAPQVLSVQSEGGGPGPIATGDVDGDGLVDIVVGDTLGGDIGVFYGDGEQSSGFDSMISYAVPDGAEGGGGAAPVAIAVGPIDAFNPPTIGIAVAAIANEPSSATISVLSVTLESETRRDLQAAFEQDVAGAPASVAIGDFTGDGNPDVVFGWSDLTQLEVITGEPLTLASGVGTTRGFAESGANTFSIDVPATALAAMDPEGQPEAIVYGSSKQSSVSVLTLLDGGESVRTGTPLQINSLALADFDNDGTPDVVLAGDNSSSITELPGHELASFGASEGFQTFTGGDDTVNPLGAIAADLQDVGGQPLPGGAINGDIAVVNSADNSVGVLLHGDTSMDTFFVGQAPYGIAAGDLNGDGFADLVVTNSGDGTITELLSNGFGGFSTQDPINVGSGPAGVAIADIDGDGHNDVIVALRTGNQVVVLTGDGAEGAPLGSPVPIAFVTNPVSVVTAALRNQGAGAGQDIVVAAESGTTLVLINADDSDVDIQFEEDLSGAGRPEAVAVGDLDGDGFLDLAVADGETNAVLTYFQFGRFGDLGDFNNSPQQSIPVGTAPTGLVVNDLDGDGFVDIAVANHGSSNVSVILNGGNNFEGPGFFRAARTLALGAGPFSIVSGDFDGNGHPDLAVSSQRTDSVELLLSPRNQK